GADGFVAAVSPAGDQDYFTFNIVAPGSTVTIETSDGLGGCPMGFDSKIYLYDPMGMEIINDDDGGTIPCSRISPANKPSDNNLPAGLYTVRVERAGNALPQALYVIKIKVTAPGCGD